MLARGARAKGGLRAFAPAFRQFSSYNDRVSPRNDEETYKQSGSTLPFLEWLEQERTVDFAKKEWPQVDYIPYFASTHGANQKLATYRYPAQGDRKGIVYYCHGYGVNALYNAHFAERLALRGYEVAGIDYRGFGRSSGILGRIEDEEICVKDILKFIEAHDEQFNDQNDP